MQADIQHHPFNSKNTINIQFLLWVWPHSDADVGIELTSYHSYASWVK